jgi:DNA invertase Pin-like site-specific DNA recombinase
MSRYNGKGEVTTMKGLQYARVSSEVQDAGDRVSIEQQLIEQDSLYERNGWEVIRVFVDKENYKATQNPRKGKIVNPSGERADRPEFLRMLEVVKTGEADFITCWRDDRLVRHPRVAVALEDALDIGDTQRNAKGKIKICDSTGATLDRFTLSIKATIWREENKRRAERVKLGKIGTLQAGRWPGTYNRLGYATRRVPGERGRMIELAGEDEVQIVRNIFNWCEAGETLRQIRRRLIAQSANQKGNYGKNRHEWDPSIIQKILRSEDYTGVATWRFSDGKSYSIPIPQIIPREQWEGVQPKLAENRRLSTRKAKWPYLLQNIAYCGDCGAKIGVANIRYFYKTLAGGTTERYDYQSRVYKYRCQIAVRFREEPHPKPFIWSGNKLDWAVWDYIVDNGISRPDLIRAQVLARQAELQQQGESADSEIAHAQRRLEEIDQERAFYQRQAARGKVTEAEFDARMDETEEAREYWHDELERMLELRDDATKVRASLDYAAELLTALQERLSGIHQTREEFRTLPEDKQRDIMKARQEIIRALCDRVLIYADGRVRIEGVIDGSEAAQFELTSPRI